MSPRAYFITGSDTGVGKTIVTAVLALTLQAQGRDPYLVKPAQSGVGPGELGDLDEIRRLGVTFAGHEGIRLREALAPEAAARIEGVALPGLDTQAAQITGVLARHDVLVEGAGGILVGLGDDWNLVDLASRVAADGIETCFVVVVRAGLGTLNHAALTVQAIRAAGHHVTGLVIGSWPSTPELVETENLRDLPRITGVPLLGRVPAGAGQLAAEDFVAAAGGWLTLA